MREFFSSFPSRSREWSVSFIFSSQTRLFFPFFCCFLFFFSLLRDVVSGSRRVRWLERSRCSGGPLGTAAAEASSTSSTSDGGGSGSFQGRQSQ